MCVCCRVNTWNSNPFFAMQRLIIMLFIVVVLLLVMTLPPPCHAALTDAEVLKEVQSVFEPLDGTEVSDIGGGGVAHLMPVLSRISATGCPEFTGNASAWEYDVNMFRACLLAVLGNLANQVCVCESSHT